MAGVGTGYRISVSAIYACLALLSMTKYKTWFLRLGAAARPGGVPPPLAGTHAALYHVLDTESSATERTTRLARREVCGAHMEHR